MTIFESETNDTPESADALALASPTRARLATLQDRDFFAVQAAAAGAINVSIDTPTNSAVFNYYSVTLLDSSGTVLSLYSTGRDATYATGVPGAGTYFIGIAPAAYHSSSEYELVATRSARPAGSYETESNDTLQTADSLTLNASITGQLATVQDTDLFSIEAELAGALEVSIDAPTNSSDFDYFSITLLDASGSVLSLYETGEDAAFTTGVPEAGTYYLAIEPADYHTADPYAVLVTQPASVGTPVVTGTSADDLLTVEPGDVVVEAGEGEDTVRLPYFVTEYSLVEQTPGKVTGTFGDDLLELNDVELLEFGTEFQTTIPIEDVISGEAQEKLGKLSDLFLAFFGRAPDIEGLEYWQEIILEAGLDLTQIGGYFAESIEAQTLYPLDVSNREFVRNIYLNAFSREPDPDGWDFWTERLNEVDTENLNERGIFVAELVLGAYAPTSGPEDGALLTNRHDVALQYVNELSIQPEEGFDPAISDLLELVTSEDGTREAAEDLLDYVFDDPISLTGVMTNPEELANFFM